MSSAFNIIRQMKKQFYIFEGELLPCSENSASNFPAHSHEIVSERVRLYNTKPLFLEEHVQHLQQSLEKVFLPMPAFATLERLSRYITRLLNVNKVYKGGIATLHVIAQAENYMFGERSQTVVNEQSRTVVSERSRTAQLAITITALPELSYTFNNTGLHILHSSEFMLPQPFMHSTYNCNSAVWNIASRYVHFNNYDIATLCNSHNYIETTTAGQLVYMKNNCLTIVGNLPVNPLFEQFLQFLIRENYSISYNKQCTLIDLENATDVFIFNIADGIRWVSRINNSVYGFKYTKDLHVLLVRFMQELGNRN